MRKRVISAQKTSKARESVFQIRLSWQERAEIELKAKAHGLKTSDYIRKAATCALKTATS